MKVFVAECTIVDHPDYECFEGVYRTASLAIKRATQTLEEEMRDFGEEETVEVTDNKLTGRRDSYHVTYNGCTCDWFIHSVEI